MTPDRIFCRGSERLTMAEEPRPAMDMIPLKPERKAQLEEYAKRRGQGILPPLSMMPWLPIANR